MRANEFQRLIPSEKKKKKKTKQNKTKQKTETKKDSNLVSFVILPIPIYIEKSSRYFFHVVRSGVC